MAMQLTTTLEAYRRLRTRVVGGNLPEMEIAALHLETHQEPTPAAAWEALVNWQPQQGWLQFQSQTVAFVDSRLPEPEANWGLLLDAEALDAQGRSLTLRTVSPGVVQRVIAQPLPAGVGGQDYLTDEVVQLATKKTGHKMLFYRRYWRQDALDGLLPFFAAFQGFAD
jgi:hypothetical protein